MEKVNEQNTIKQSPINLQAVGYTTFLSSFLYEQHFGRKCQMNFTTFLWAREKRKKLMLAYTE